MLGHIQSKVAPCDSCLAEYGLFTNIFFSPDSIEMQMKNFFRKALSTVLANIRIGSMDNLDELEVCALVKLSFHIVLLYISLSFLIPIYLITHNLPRFLSRSCHVRHISWMTVNT